MTEQVIAQRLTVLFERRKRAFREKNWAEAEVVCEDEIALGRRLVALSPRSEYEYSLGVSLWHLGRALVFMGAHPEAEEPLLESVSILEHNGVFNVGDSDPDLIDALTLLAAVYGGGEFYVDPSGPLISETLEMREYRRARLGQGGGSAQLLTAISEDWPLRSEPPLREAIRISRVLAVSGEETWRTKLAHALHDLGKVLIDLDRQSEAIELLEEARSIYGDLVRSDPEYILPSLNHTDHLLLLAAAASPSSSDKMGALEAMLPQLRQDAYATPAELDIGVTLAKAAARARLSQALQELAQLYEEAGNDQPAKALWDGELGVLYTESLKIRR